MSAVKASSKPNSPKKPTIKKDVHPSRKVEDVQKIYESMPTKDGLFRKIHHLWDNVYRVNYHNPADSNVIAESFFVKVINGEVVADMEKKTKPNAD